RRAARAPPRPLLHARGQRTGAGGPALLGQLPPAALQPARPDEPPRRALAIPLPEQANHMTPPLPKGLRPRPARPGTKPARNGARANGATVTQDPKALTQAYGSVRHIINDVFLGEFVRGMHKWGATVMVVLIFLHMGRTFFFGAYKYPRELNWIIGVVLLILTMAMAFTGYLLPFDQRSFWATVVGVNINASGPILGPYLADFLRGGAEFGST